LRAYEDIGDYPWMLYVGALKLVRKTSFKWDMPASDLCGKSPNLETNKKSRGA
jgi:hypothetical protein